MLDTQNIPLIDSKAFLNEDLFTLLKMEEATNEQREGIAKKLLEVVEARVYTASIKSLQPDKRMYAASLAADEMIPYFLEEGVDLPVLIYQEGIRYRAELVQLSLATAALTAHEPSDIWALKAILVLE